MYVCVCVCECVCVCVSLSLCVCVCVSDDCHKASAYAGNCLCVMEWMRVENKRELKQLKEGEKERETERRAVGWMESGR